MIRGGAELAEGGLPWPTGPQALVLQTVIGPADKAEAAFRTWCSQIDIDEHLDGGTYRLLPLMYQRLNELGVEDPLMGRLKGVYRRTWVETHGLFADMKPVVAKLQAAGVRIMLVKGVPLALTYYRSHATRPMMDLDVVVPRSQRDLAFSVMDELGWTTGDRIRSYEIYDQNGVDFRNDKDRELDLHWNCLREAQSDEADAWFWRDAQPIVFEGMSLWQPRPTAMLLHLVLHGVRSNLEPPIRWIVDSAMVIRADPAAIDWDDLVEFARRQRLTHRLSLGLDYLAETYGLPVPEKTLAALKASGVSLIERFENMIYLAPASNTYRPVLYPFADYWRHLRWLNVWAFLTGFIPYLQRRWRLEHEIQVPMRLAGALLKRVVRPTASVQS